MTIKCIADIYTRCIEDGDCMIWNGSVNRDGFPYAYYEGHSRGLRRLVLEWTSGEKCPPNKVASTKCHNSRCLSEAHVFSGTKKEISREKSKIGCYGRPASVAKMTRTQRAKTKKLTMEKAREIRQNEECSYSELAIKYGVNRKTIYSIKRGTKWAEGLSKSSVFNWRPAA